VTSSELLEKVKHIIVNNCVATLVMRETVLPMLCTETKNLKGDDGDDDKI